ncbi:hypothetical protein Leryth_023882 [Lithospermum erythrorhizon]|nr:hypothetical protein Leryth_023882 [Lithospermum erythrorhizon]
MKNAGFADVLSILCHVRLAKRKKKEKKMDYLNPNNNCTSIPPRLFASSGCATLYYSSHSSISSHHQFRCVKTSLKVRDRDLAMVFYKQKARNMQL